MSLYFIKTIIYHHHHHISVMQLGHLLTRSGLTYPEVCSKVYHDSFRQLDSSVSLPWAIYFEAFSLHVVSSFSCIPLICPKFVLFLAPLQFVLLFCIIYVIRKTVRRWRGSYWRQWCVCIMPRQRQSFTTDTILSKWRPDLTSTLSDVIVQAFLPAVLQFECAAAVFRIQQTRTAL